MKSIGQKLSSIIVALTILLTLQFSAFASTITPSIIEYDLEPSSFKLGEIKYKNTTDNDETVVISVDSYDAKEEKIVSVTPLITIAQKELTIKKSQEIGIKYVVNIPDDKPQGTYFNLISIQPKSSNKQANTLDVKKGVGSLVVIHVLSSGTSIEKIFANSSDTQLVIENTGFPFIYPLKLKYVYINNSNFVFRPEGEIRIVDNNGQQVSQRYEINPEKKALYPGDKIDISEQVMTWSDVNQIVNNKDVIARIYNGFDTNYISNEVSVSILPQIIASGVLVLTLIILLIIGIIAIISTVIKRIKTKRVPAL